MKNENDLPGFTADVSLYIKQSENSEGTYMKKAPLASIIAQAITLKNTALCHLKASMCRVRCGFGSNEWCDAVCSADLFCCLYGCDGGTGQPNPTRWPDTW